MEGRDGFPDYGHNDELYYSMMMRLKKYLLAVLVLCTLGYSSAWAYDIHAIADDHLDSSDQLIASQSNNTDHSPGQTETAKICDHSCHAFAHMLAIATQNVSLYSCNKNIQRMDVAEALVSLTINPHQRPPRA